MASIAHLLAGEDNTTAATIDTLDSSRERASVVGYLLIILPDQEKCSGDGAGIKAVTGGEAVTIDPKYRDAWSTHIPVVILAVNNNPMRFSNRSGGVSLRRVTLHFPEVNMLNKTIENFGRPANFDNLSTMQKSGLCRIVESTGRSSAKVDLKMERLSSAGKGLIFLSMAIAIYEIYTAQDKVSESTRQATIAGSGMAGGRAAGSFADLVCGPDAPVWILIDSFMGGVLAAW